VGGQAEHRAAEQRLRTVFDLADVEVAVLERRREVADLERRPHPGVLTRRHATAEHERLGSAADRGVAGPDDDVAGPGGGEIDGADLALAGSAEPEGTCRATQINLVS
jgi:hypothetical protein